MYKKFAQIYPRHCFEFQEIKSEIDFALQILFDYTYKDYLLGRDLEQEQIETAKKLFEKRVQTRKPIQQLLGAAYFFGRKFYVDEFTLVPRPETELLVQETLAAAEKLLFSKKSNILNVLDIGTGTGCIAITLMLENKNIKADMSDILPQALKTAEKNSKCHNVIQNACFINSDLFENINKKYDIIVSNPPYIPIKDKMLLQPEVRDYEPPEALFASDNDGIEFYKKIIPQLMHHLNEKSAIVFEIGINQSNQVYELLSSCGFNNIRIKKDFNGIDRIISAENWEN